MVLDKTGTITKGEPSITDVAVFFENEKDKVVRYAASLEKLSEHPIAQSIVAYAASLGSLSSHPLDRAVKAAAEKTELLL